MNQLAIKISRARVKRVGRTLVCTTMVLLTVVMAVAQNPTLNYQAVIRDGSNNLVIETAVDATVYLYNGTAPVYSEEHTAISTDRNGLLNIPVGAGAGLGNFSNIDWSIAQIHIELSWTGGTATLMRTPFTVVPTALFSDKTSYANLPKVTTIAAPATHDSLATEGSVKTYVDEKLNGLSNYVTKSGDNNFTGGNTFTGTIVVPNRLEETTLAITTGDCTQALNLCDLKLAFDTLVSRIDSINNQRGRQIAELLDSIAALRDSIENLLPSATIPLTLVPSTASPINICAGSSVDVTYTVTGGSAPYKWFVNGTEQSGETANTLTRTYNATISEEISVTALHCDTPKTTTAVTELTDFPVLSLCTDNTGGTVWLSTVANTQTIDVIDATDNIVKSLGVVSNDTLLVTPADGLANGNYTVKATHTNGCTVSYPVTINHQTAPCLGTLIAGVEDGADDAITHVSDHQGNRYEVVQIGKQCWMRENMRATTSRKTGTSLLQNPASGYNYNIPYCYYYDDDVKNVSRYGVLYNLKAAFDTTFASIDIDAGFPENHRGLCPAGWHIPNQADWTAMEINALSLAPGSPAPIPPFGSSKEDWEGKNTQIAALLSNSCWWSGTTAETDGKTPNSYNNPNRNKSLFSAIPAGYYDGESTSFEDIGGYAAFYVNDEVHALRYLETAQNGMRRSYNGKDLFGNSLRCVRDMPTLSVTMTGGGTTFCDGATTVAATYTATGGSEPYHWTVNGVDSTTTTNTLVVNWPNPGSGYTDDYRNLIVVTADNYGYAGIHVSLGEGNTPVIELCEDPFAGTISLKSASNANTINIYDNSHTLKKSINPSLLSSDSLLVTTADNYPNGTYTVEAISHTGCAVEQTATIARVQTSCAIVGAVHSSETTSGGQITAVTDHEGNSYQVAQIGNQCWMRENMRATTRKTGSSMQQYGSLMSTTEPYCYYYDDNSANAAIYGALYNWNAAVDSVPAGGTWTSSSLLPKNHRGICPEGWHLPTDEQWGEFALAHITNEDPSIVPSPEMGSPAADWEAANTQISARMASSCYWNGLTPGTNGKRPNSYENPNRNSFRFSALPAGILRFGFEGIKVGTYFWGSSNEAHTADNATGYGIAIVEDGYDRITSASKACGFSVRCMRNIPQLSLTANYPEGTLDLCENSRSYTVTYTAEPGHGPYSWYVNGVPQAETSNTLTRTYNSAGNNHIEVSAPYYAKTTHSINVANTPKPIISICENEDAGTVTLRSHSSADTIKFYDATNTLQQAISAPFPASGTLVNSGEIPDGLYSVVATNTAGCQSVQYQAIVTTPKTFCTGTIRSNENGTSGRIEAVKDHQDNWYEVVQIGTQCWMRQNMRATKFRRTYATYSGNNIPQAPVAADQVKHPYIFVPAETQYGVLYNFSAAIDTNISSATLDDFGNSARVVQGICPNGWHLPSNAEWNTLANAIVGMESPSLSPAPPFTTTASNTRQGTNTQIAAMMSSSCLWTGSQTGGVPNNYGAANRNASLFSALPAGYYNHSGSEYHKSAGKEADFFSTKCQEISSVDKVSVRCLDLDANGGLYLYYNDRLTGASVRCVRD